MITIKVIYIAGETVDKISRAYYEKLLELDYIKQKATTFQDWFSEIMEKRFPSDFQRVRPWGHVGDRKNDGYLKSARMLFQAYAPNELTSASAISKIEEDFRGALPFWKIHFDTWVFVHNSREGLGPDVLSKLLTLEVATGVNMKNWGFEEIRKLVFELDDVEIASLLGPAPSNDEVDKVNFSSLQLVLETIGRREPSQDPDLRPVPQDKIKINALSPDVETLLRGGMRKSNLVSELFNTWYDPKLGDEIAANFNNRYEECKKATLPPDKIFEELHKFAGGLKRGSVQHEASVLAVLAYFFERCDIFENPKENDVEVGL